jgi:hypothetical protein
MAPAPADGPQASLDPGRLHDNEGIVWPDNGRGVYAPWVSNKHSTPRTLYSMVISIGINFSTHFRRWMEENPGPSQGLNFRPVIGFAAYLRGSCR